MAIKIIGGIVEISAIIIITRSIVDHIPNDIITTVLATARRIPTPESAERLISVSVQLSPPAEAGGPLAKPESIHCADNVSRRRAEQRMGRSATIGQTSRTPGRGR